ncbi:hypothetical protein C8R45DRAFT_935356 [Mycena sanguinolenta]|nr:hypothetical protein C8R45DRAFT_935356 [Mycena sanguinolenta]
MSTKFMLGKPKRLSADAKLPEPFKWRLHSGAWLFLKPLKSLRFKPSIFEASNVKPLKSQVYMQSSLKYSNLRQDYHIFWVFLVGLGSRSVSGKALIMLAPRIYDRSDRSRPVWARCHAVHD